MNSLQSTVNALKAQYDAAKKEADKIGQELWKAESELKARQMKALSKRTKKHYLKRLKRLRRIMIDWRESVGPYSGDIEVAFRKQEGPYQDDYHEDMDDPLDWMIAEYDLLAMSKNMEIRIDYFNEAVKEFVKVWFDTHHPTVRIVEERGLFAFR